MKRSNDVDERRSRVRGGNDQRFVHVRGGDVVAENREFFLQYTHRIERLCAIEFTTSRVGIRRSMFHVSRACSDGVKNVERSCEPTKASIFDFSSRAS